MKARNFSEYIRLNESSSLSNIGIDKNVIKYLYKKGLIGSDNLEIEKVKNKAAARVSLGKDKYVIAKSDYSTLVIFPRRKTNLVYVFEDGKYVGDDWMSSTETMKLITKDFKEIYVLDDPLKDGRKGDNWDNTGYELRSKLFFGDSGFHKYLIDVIDTKKRELIEYVNKNLPDYSIVDNNSNFQDRNYILDSVRNVGELNHLKDNLIKEYNKEEPNANLISYGSFVYEFEDRLKNLGIKRIQDIQSKDEAGIKKEIRGILTDFKNKL